MKLIKPSFEILSNIESENILKNIEQAGRTCYKSEDKITENSAKEFVKMILRRGHESVVEHEKITIKFICDRGVSHELVRHRIASFSQESTRYCNYSKDKFDNQLTFILPEWTDLESGYYGKSTTDVHIGDFIAFSNNKDLSNYKKVAIQKDWDSPQIRNYLYLDSLLQSEYNYIKLLEVGWTPQQARSVLPNSLKTEIVVTANLREWREIFRQRTSKAAHPQMRELMCPLLDEVKGKLPVIFDDINYE